MVAMLFLLTLKYNCFGQENKQTIPLIGWGSQYYCGTHSHFAVMLIVVASELDNAILCLMSCWMIWYIFLWVCMHINFYTAWGIYTAIYFLLGIVVGGFILLLRFSLTRDWIINIAIALVYVSWTLHVYSCNSRILCIRIFRAPVIWAEVILWLQFLLCKYIYISDKDGKFVSITNRYLKCSYNIYTCTFIPLIISDSSLACKCESLNTGLFI